MARQRAASYYSAMNIGQPQARDIDQLFVTEPASYQRGWRRENGRRNDAALERGESFSDTAEIKHFNVLARL